MNMNTYVSNILLIFPTMLRSRTGAVFQITVYCKKKEQHNWDFFLRIFNVFGSDRLDVEKKVKKLIGFLTTK